MFAECTGIWLSIRELTDLFIFKEPGEAGMALYEKTWKPTKDHNCEILFCNEDFAQKVYMRKVKPGAHPAAGMKLTAKSAEHVLQRYPLLREKREGRA